MLVPLIELVNPMHSSNKVWSAQSNIKPKYSNSDVTGGLLSLYPNGVWDHECIRTDIFRVLMGSTKSVLDSTASKVPTCLLDVGILQTALLYILNVMKLLTFLKLSLVELNVLKKKKRILQCTCTLKQ